MRRCLFSIPLWTISTSALAPAGIPACAQSAISAGIRGSSCAIDDYSCICASENFKFALESADDACNEADKEILYNVLWKFCSGTVLGTRDVNEDDASAGEGDVQDDTPSPTVASEGTDMNTLGTSVITATPTVASEGTDMSTLNTPVVASTPTIASEGTDQATLGTPVPAGTATVATEGTDQATLSTPTVIAPPTTPLPTTATSIATDTRGGALGDDPNGLTSGTTTSPGPADTALLTINATSSTSSLLSQDPSSTTGEAGSEVDVSVGALVVAVTGLTWVFAEF